MTDVVLLDSLLKDSKIKKGDLAKTLGLSRQGLWKKLHNQIQWNTDEIAMVQALLHLTDTQTIDIFLRPCRQNNS